MGAQSTRREIHTAEKLHARFRRKGRPPAAFSWVTPQPCAFEPIPTRREAAQNTPVARFRIHLGTELYGFKSTAIRNLACNISAVWRGESTQVGGDTEVVRIRRADESSEILQLLKKFY